MGNSLGCSGTGERLMAAAREGDIEEARTVLALKPSAARFCTFGVRSSPIHFAAARGHTEIVNLLLEHGTDVDCRNYCGQTAMMHACRFGRWEVVQALVIRKANICKFDLLSGRLAIHYAAASGHVQCLRLLVADLVPSTLPGCKDDDEANQFPNRELLEVVNARADSGVTALHFAALNGHTECVTLLLDLGARVNALTCQEGMQEWDDIGNASTPLHYAACNGSVTCCQVLLARGADRNFKNDNGWTPQHVARFWKRQAAEELLTPEAVLDLPAVPTSRYLAFPLRSALSIARMAAEGGKTAEGETCGVCLERPTAVASASCGHQLCIRCSLNLCSTGSLHNGSSNLRHGQLPCPFCRQGIVQFVTVSATSPPQEEATEMRTPLECLPSSPNGDPAAQSQSPFQPSGKEESFPAGEDCSPTSPVVNG